MELKESNNGYDKQINKKEVKIPAYIVLLLIVSVIVILNSFNAYAKETKNIAVAIDKKEELINNENVINEVEAKNSNEEKEEVNDEELSSDEEAEEDIEVEAQTEVQQESVTYYSASGEQYSIIGKVSVPSLGIEQDILSKTSPELLKIVANKYWGANPNEVGNMVVGGHNYKDSRFFGNLSKIQVGSIIKITDSTGRTLDYTVYMTDIVDPNDNSCTSQLTNGRVEVTLFTCYYRPGDTHASMRFIAKARAN